MKNLQFLIDIFLPVKAYKRKIHEFADKYKKEYHERTIAEKIICDGFFHINFSGKNDRRFYGSLEATLILEGYFKPGQQDIFKKDGYQKTIYNMSEQYLKDKNIL